MYGKKSLDGYYFRTTGFYIFHIPVKVPYKEIYAMADRAGVKQKVAGGPILEWSKMLGTGYIGVEVEKPGQDRDDVIRVAGSYDMYEHKGPYRTLGKAYKKIMKERSNIKECMNLYLDDPANTSPEQCRTQIIFR